MYEYEEFGSKRYKSILINLSKNVFSLPRKWQNVNHYFLFQTFT